MGLFFWRPNWFQGFIQPTPKYTWNVHLAPVSVDPNPLLGHSSNHFKSNSVKLCGRFEEVAQLLKVAQFWATKTWATETNHLQASRPETMWTPVSLWRSDSNLGLSSLLGLIWVEDVWGRNMSSLNFWVQEVKKFKFGGFGPGCILSLKSTKIEGKDVFWWNAPYWSDVWVAAFIFWFVKISTCVFRCVKIRDWNFAFYERNQKLFGKELGSFVCHQTWDCFIFFCELHSIYLGAFQMKIWLYETVQNRYNVHIWNRVGFVYM